MNSNLNLTDMFKQRQKQLFTCDCDSEPSVMTKTQAVIQTDFQLIQTVTHLFVIFIWGENRLRLNPHYENWIFGNCHAKYYKSVIIPTYAFIFQELQDKFGPHILTPT